MHIDPRPREFAERRSPRKCQLEASELVRLLHRRANAAAAMDRHDGLLDVDSRGGVTLTPARVVRKMLDGGEARRRVTRSDRDERLRKSSMTAPEHPQSESALPSTTSGDTTAHRETDPSQSTSTPLDPSPPVKHRTSSSWRERVLARVELLEADVERLSHETVREPPRPVLDAHTRTRIDELLCSARDAVNLSKQSFLIAPHRISAWWTGWTVERAWRDIHAAEVLLAGVRPWHDLDSDRPALQSLASAALPSSDPQRASIDELLAPDGWPDAEDSVMRARYAALLRAVYEASDDQYARIRSFRNIILLTALMLTLLAAAIVGFSVWKPSAIPVCFSPDLTNTSAGNADMVCPSGIRQTASDLDVLLIELLGMVGAALAAAFALRNIRGTSTPYEVPVALALLKVPAGALTAFVGLMFVRAAFVPGLTALDSQNQILGYAILFGYAQQLITGLVDKQGQTLLNDSSPRDQTQPTEPTASPPAPNR